MAKFKKIFVTTYVNILIFLCFIILIELILGHWFKKNNFGIHMRAERNKVIKINVNHHFGDKIEFIYKRNFF